MLIMTLILSPAVMSAASEAEKPAEQGQSTAEHQVAAEVAAPHALLMEVSTGTVLMGKAEDEKLHPASVTKIMTLLLILEAIEDGKIALSDMVSVSEHASSMGGSQVYLEPFEQQTVETMIKCIAVASANDACVAMAEHISGSEGDFVRRMNERAAELGMTNTHFVNCCGLDDDEHLTTARDVALMSRELLLNHPQIHEYCTIWMENIIHTTAKGSFEFGLTNTNKLIKQYEYATGLKTGYTSVAGFCVSASAKKDNIELIAVIMGGADSKSRFQDAVTLLNSGFACCSLYQDENRVALSDLPVSGGVEDRVPLKYAGDFSYVSTDGSNLSDMKRSLELPEEIPAPVEEGSTVGRVAYILNGKEIGESPILAAGNVEKAGYGDYIQRAFHMFLL
ncbi:MAG: D-alanyl-D-alanine carboxypeptidase [Lachnospiraceae bacterium]|nr:D-alanyl-D-alanine carboxypeptidase [Lachnospiraceae bacterium]MCI9599935.1 D-alanyl-D-alanine carboxypeptidase [Lachnospiraceae bacterium]